MYAGKINGPCWSWPKGTVDFSGLDEPGLALRNYRGLTLPTLDWATMDTKILTYAGSWMRAGRFWLSSRRSCRNFLLAGERGN